MTSEDHYKSLDDFLISMPHTVDATVKFGPELSYPVKGREIEATVLFSDISGYSARTLDLSPAETLAFVNQFFTWMTAMALRGTHGIVDKYIGDEMMIVFSEEFGSEDAFGEAVRVARRMGAQDLFGFVPHVGIASGRVIVGHAGTPLMYNCSVFGGPVALAARCAGIRPDEPEETEGGFPSYGCSITFPEADWGGRQFDNFFPPTKCRDGEGRIVTERPTTWELLPARTVTPKNMRELEIREAVDRAIYFPETPPEVSARETVEQMRAANRYWPPGGSSESSRPSSSEE